MCDLAQQGPSSRRWRLAPLGDLCVGAGLVAWVIVEAAWIVVAPALQLLVGAVERSSSRSASLSGRRSVALSRSTTSKARQRPRRRPG